MTGATPALLAPGLGFPEYPWDQLVPFRQRAQAHPDGLCDLSIGTPVDPTPQVIQDALSAAGNAHGYPTTAGSKELRQAIAGWYQRWHGVELDPAHAILPTIGSKELVAWLPTLLGLRQADLSVALPSVAYPTYAIGATLAGVPFVTLDAAEVAAGADLSGVGLVWLNTPGNPHGEVLSVEVMRAVVEAARAAGVVVASDECYGLLNWAGDSATRSILSPEVSGGDHRGLLAVYSLSKQSNLAGYRAAFVAGDPVLVHDLTRSRKHAGMIVPAPVQAAMIAALDDADHVLAQKARYGARREQLWAGIEACGMTIDHSQAGLYFWARRAGDTDCWQTLDFLADRGIVAAPGEFYGPAGKQHVRIALTASDERIAAAATRLSQV